MRCLCLTTWTANLFRITNVCQLKKPWGLKDHVVVLEESHCLFIQNQPSLAM